MKEKLKCLMKRSFDRFIASDLKIIRANANERTLCGRLSIHMHCLLHDYDLKDYYVDVEYNRKHGLEDCYGVVESNRKHSGHIKTICDEKTRGSRKIVRDIILHSRGRPVQRHNLIAIEMKKSTRSKKDRNEDRERLEALTKEFDEKNPSEHVCDYQLGFYIELLNTRRVRFLFERYEQGQIRDEWHRSFYDYY